MKAHLEKLIINLTIYAERTNEDALTLINSTKELQKCQVEKLKFFTYFYCKLQNKNGTCLNKNIQRLIYDKN